MWSIKIKRSNLERLNCFKVSESNEAHRTFSDRQSTRVQKLYMNHLQEEQVFIQNLLAISLSESETKILSLRSDQKTALST